MVWESTEDYELPLVLQCGISQHMMVKAGVLVIGLITICHWELIVIFLTGLTFLIEVTSVTFMVFSTKDYEHVQQYVYLIKCTAVCLLLLYMWHIGTSDQIMGSIGTAL